jgi:hypothetical protein
VKIIVMERPVRPSQQNALEIAGLLHFTAFVEADVPTQ